MKIKRFYKNSIQSFSNAPASILWAFFFILGTVAGAAFFYLGMYYNKKKSIGIEYPKGAQTSQVVEAQNPLTALNNSRTIDLKEFNQVLNIIEENYVPAPDEKGSKKEKPLTLDQRLDYAIAGLVASTKDPFSSFFPKKEAKDFRSTVIDGELEGIGIWLSEKNNSLVVLSAVPNSPAAKSGIQAGDIILKVGDTSIIGYSADEATQIIRGKKGTPITLSIFRKSLQKEISITIIRDKITIPTLSTRVYQNVFIISMYSFTQHAYRDFASALRDYNQSNVDRLVIDLRDNPGGIVDEAIAIASIFLPVNSPIFYEYTGGNLTDATAVRSVGTPALDKKIPIYVLVNRNSASASEILALALKEYDIATIVGERTFGKGSVQQVFNTINDGIVKVTIGHWLSPKTKKSFSNIGVDPKIDFTKGDEKIIDEYDRFDENGGPLAVEKDAFLKKAISLIQKE
ncbi:MAG: S41 family peptidase [Alphaproteobacteria bacterium]|nr:S41 family peptidase [Alphaproteobacteria bacterium]